MALSSDHAQAVTTISLTPSEQLVRKCLLECLDQMKDSVPGMRDLKLRFAGGWVRDKLLGKQSHDIDVALSTMTGEQYGEALEKFMKSQDQKYLDEARAQGIPAIVKGLHKVKKNPEASKHLETTMTTLFGLDMDFVNLRKEVYDDSSRNPQMEFGTPEEDALRRDATVNALFYELDEQVVEDFTGKGLDDMKNKIIRTPLEPYQTFKDDPLRVLRLIRFASRLGYEIESSAYEAMKDSRIHKALKVKISRERVGVELGKIMAGPDPYGGLMYIYDRHLYGVVFGNPASENCPDDSMIPTVYKCIVQILEERSTICLGLRPQDDCTMTWFLASYVPWSNSGQGAVMAAREGIKATNVLSKTLGDAIKHRSALVRMVAAVHEGNPSRSLVGTTLRNAGAAWRHHVLYSLLCDACTGEFDAVFDRYETFFKYLQTENLWDAADLKPIINGNEIKKAMNTQKVGPWLKRTIDVVVEWQFDHPNGTAQDAKDMVASKRDELQDS